MSQLGSPRLQLREVGSTNDRARELAERGAPHGTLVSADLQSGGRGRQGRQWVAPARSAALISLIIREPPALLPLIAAVAVAEACGPQAKIKWPNDILLSGDDGRIGKVAGILCEARAQQGWAVVGIGVNVALRLDQLPDELRSTAATLGLTSDDREAVIAELVEALQRCLLLAPAELLGRWQARDALRGQQISWQDASGEASGVAQGVNSEGALIVETSSGQRLKLNAGEVHLTTASR